MRVSVAAMALVASACAASHSPPRVCTYGVEPSDCAPDESCAWVPLTSRYECMTRCSRTAETWRCPTGEACILDAHPLTEPPYGEVCWNRGSLGAGEPCDTWDYLCGRGMVCVDGFCEELCDADCPCTEPGDFCHNFACVTVVPRD